MKLTALLFCVGKRVKKAELVAMKMLSLMNVSIHRSLSQKFLLRHIEETGFDFADKPTVFYGDEEESPYANDKERLLALLKHLEENYPRHYKAFLMIKEQKSAEEICGALGFVSGSKRVCTIMDETIHLCYKFFGSGVLSTKAILDHKRRAKEAKKNLLF